MGIELRPATLDDVGLVADLETAHTPDDPHDAEMVLYWWTHAPDARHAIRLIGDNVYFSARHCDWKAGGRRYGFPHVVIHPSAWSAALFRTGLATTESWLKSEQAEVSVARIRADFDDELKVVRRHGYQDVREERLWELDLVARHDALIAGAERSRALMRGRGIEMLTLEEDRDEATLKKVYALDMESTQDIPTTVPHYEPSYEEWQRSYFENPGIRKDRFWVARRGDEIVGMSLIEYPPGRGVPSTEYTGTSPRHRGRGIARALKYETIAQAIALGATRVRTDNDSENAPILHINAEMGYEPMTPFIELHRDL